MSLNSWTRELLLLFAQLPVASSLFRINSPSSVISSSDNGRGGANGAAMFRGTVVLLIVVNQAGFLLLAVMVGCVDVNVSNPVFASMVS